jgi:tagatose 1,6-diphosphate aldolase
VLLDPEYGAAQAIAAGVMPASKGLLVSLEETGYGGHTKARVTRLLAGWNVKKAKRMGASAVKLLIYFRPDLKDIASKQLDLVAGLADECVEEDIPLLVEPVTYPVEEEGSSAKRFADVKPDLVIETARLVTALPVDVLKSEFPTDIRFERDDGRLLKLCQELNEASRLPWVLLSAGVDFEAFKRQVEIACKAGASGFLAGRALWQEAAGIPLRKERLSFFRNTATPRLKELVGIADSYGKPWYLKLGSEDGRFVPPGADWYPRY